MPVVALLSAALVLLAGGTGVASAKVDPGFEPYSVSCPVAGFCVAVGRPGFRTSKVGGYAAIFRSGKWSKPHRLAARMTPLSVSCASPSFCLAVGLSSGFSGHPVAWTFNGRRWGSPMTIARSAARQVHASCPSTSSCMVVDQTDAFSYVAGRWAKPVTLDSGVGRQGPGGITDVSCSSIKACVALGQDANDDTLSWAFDGRSWGQPVGAGGVGDGPYALSCSGLSFCMGVGSPASLSAIPKGYALTYNGARWGHRQATHDLLPASVSCASRSFCMVVGFTQATSYRGNGWGKATKIDPNSAPVGENDEIGVVSVSCPSRSFCAAVDYLGNGLTFDGRAWSEPTLI
jgi:hypothetical protein